MISLAETGNVNDLLGVVVSYSIKIKLVLSGMGGELETDLPFKLVHPCPSKSGGSSESFFSLSLRLGASGAAGN